jgi:hypothetical protein
LEQVHFLGAGFSSFLASAKTSSAWATTGLKMFLAMGVSYLDISLSNRVYFFSSDFCARL